MLAKQLKWRSGMSREIVQCRKAYNCSLRGPIEVKTFVNSGSSTTTASSALKYRHHPHQQIDERQDHPNCLSGGIELVNLTGRFGKPRVVKLRANQLCDDV